MYPCYLFIRIMNLFYFSDRLKMSEVPVGSAPSSAKKRRTAALKAMPQSLDANAERKPLTNMAAGDNTSTKSNQAAAASEAATTSSGTAKSDSKKKGRKKKPARECVEVEGD